MWELDGIFRSIYILKYIDNIILRQNVQRALNRGEVYHQLHRVIFYQHSGKFRVETESEQNIWGECSILVANTIICYNAYLLNGLSMDQMIGEKQFDFVERVKRVSPIAWRHSNLGGIFKLIHQKKALGIDLMLSRLGEFLAQSTF